MDLKPCPCCGDAWFYVSDMTWGSGYENKGYKVNCKCGYAWNRVDWQKTKEDTAEEWNRKR